MAAQTIPELTNYQYNELSYNSASPIIKGNFILDEVYNGFDDLNDFLEL